MIKSKRELAFFIQADRIMNGFPEKRSILTYMKEFFHPQGNVKIGDNVTVATHSLVLSDCVANTLVAGSPSIVKAEDCQPWYRRDGELYFKRVETVKYLKLKYGI